KRTGGQGRNRTGVHGFAGRCITTLPPGQSERLLRRAQTIPQTPVARAAAAFAAATRGLHNALMQLDLLRHLPLPWLLFALLAGCAPEAAPGEPAAWHPLEVPAVAGSTGDRKSTRLNSSHVKISYAVFCLKKKKKPNQT